MHSKRASALLVLITSGDSGTDHREVARALDVAALLWGIERMVVIAAAVVLLLVVVVVVVVVVLYVGSGRLTSCIRVRFKVSTRRPAPICG